MTALSPKKILYFGGKLVKACVDLNCDALQHFGAGQSWKLSLSECLKVRCGIWLICLCDLAFLGSCQSRSLKSVDSDDMLRPHLFSEERVSSISDCMGETREMRSRCPVSDWDQNPAIKRQALPDIVIFLKVLKLIFFFVVVVSLSLPNGKWM